MGRLCFRSLAFRSGQQGVEKKVLCERFFSQKDPTRPGIEPAKSQLESCVNNQLDRSNMSYYYS